MGLFSGGNSSSSNLNQTFNNDKRVVADGGSLGISTDGAVSVLDGGAINSAFSFASSGLDKAAGLMLASLQSKTDSEKSAMKFAYDAGKPEAALLSDYGKYFAAGLALVGAVMVWRFSR